MSQNEGHGAVYTTDDYGIMVTGSKEVGQVSKALLSSLSFYKKVESII
jgi:hypothetical protein